MSGIGWKLRRLRAMGPAEVAFRIRRAVETRIEARQVGREKPVPTPDTAKFGRSWLPDAGRPRVDAADYVAVADRILAGRFDIFDLEDQPLGFPPDWNRDPRTGTRIPLKFGKAIDYRRAEAVGDIRTLWELNRHMELVTLAQAWRLTGEERHLQGCRQLVDSWLDACPYPLGANWISALEHALRLVNWALAWHLLGGGKKVAAAFGEELLGRWLVSIHRHCEFIAGHLSRHSSANNHLFGEFLGLFVAGTTWPCWEASARWRALGHRGLESEALLQVAPDGVDLEQAIWYHHEVADMMIFAGLLGRQNGHDFSAGFWQRLEGMMDFIAALMDRGGRIPMIGDADDASILHLTPRPDLPVFHSQLATGALLFGRADLARKAVACDDKTRWLLGPAADESFAALSQQPAPAPRRAFPDGGYWILGDQLGDEQEVRIVADAGSLGYLSIAAHGHADALSLVMSAGGREILVDPGTYGYAAPPEWRRFFRGTAAHNTVRLDGADQSEYGGSFLWNAHARAGCLRFESGPDEDVWEGWHDGYARLKDPVRHCRTVLYRKRARILRVEDRLDCRAEHSVELFWHLAEDLEPEVAGGEVRLAAGRPIAVSMPGCSWEPSVVRGQESPPQGWVSRRYGQKVPAPALVWAGRIRGATTLVTEFRL